MADTQWSIKVKIESLDRGGVQVKNMWTAGETVVVQIEPHATINMLKQRIALLVAAHMKHQRITNEAGEDLDDITKLQDAKGLADNGTLLLHVEQPKEEEKPIEPLSDDEQLWGAEEVDVEPFPSEEVAGKELTDEEMDKQGELKGAAAELLEDGDKEAALKKMTEAILIGAPTAMMISKRAELLLKLKRAKAAEKDATEAIKVNPDSGKAFRVRGRARRFLGDYTGAKSDLDQAQRIDYDDGVEDLHTYVKKRCEKMAALEARKAKEAEAEPEASA